MIEPGSSTAALASTVVERLRGDLTAIDGPPQCSTGLGALDDLLQGLRPGRVYVLGGRHGVGKTALVLGIAKVVAETGAMVLYRSLDMTADDIVLRLVSSVSCVALSDVQTRNMHPDDWLSWRRLLAAMDHIQGLPLMIDAGDGDSADLIRRANVLGSEHDGLGLVVVDDLQRLALSEPGASRVERVEALMQRLRGLARDFAVPVVVCAQCNGPTRARDTHRPPAIGDLRDSDAIANNADGILLLAATEAGLGPGLAQLQVAKNRHGSTGAVPLAFLDHIVRFAEIASPA